MPASRTHARYGPTDRYSAAPGAGMCLSAFALVRQRGRTLVGRPAPHAKWDAFMPSWKHYEPADLAATMAGLVLPGTYLYEGEDPRDTVDRVMRGLLGIRQYEVAKRPRVYTSTAKSGWYPGHEHWDVAFVYDVRASAPAKTPPWWRELAWKSARATKAREFQWNADLAKWLSIAR